MPGDYRYYGPGEVKASLDRMEGHPILSIDVETYSATDPIPVGIGIAISPEESFYFDLLPASPDIPWHLLRDPGITKLMHNAPFDLRVLREWGVDTTNCMDTAIMARMACIPGNLDDACRVVETRFRPEHMKDVWNKHGVDNTIDLPPEVCALKCCIDTLGTFELFNALKVKVNMEYLKREMALLPILEAMSSRGIKLDQDIRTGLEYAYSQELEQLDDLCADTFGFNPASPQQVAMILSKRGNFLPKKRAKNGRWSLTTDEATLEKILHVEPLAGLVLHHRHLKKMLGTYLIPYRDMDRAYTYFHLDAATARISSSSYNRRLERNLQNIPGVDPEDRARGNTPITMRNMYLPDNGMFTSTDLSQIELRILAYISNDRRMQDILNDPDGDLHMETAKFLGVPRKTAKNCTFAIVYGATAQTVMETAHIADIRLAQRMLDMIFSRYHGMGDWIRSTQEFGLRHGFIETLEGRRIAVWGEDDNLDDRKVVAHIYRIATNYPIQGSAAEIMKNGLIISFNKVWQGMGIPMAHQVHDEIIWDGYVDTPKVIDSWFNGQLAPFPTPTSTKYMDRWE